MHRFLAVFLMVSSAYGQTVLDESDQNLEPEDAKAMMSAVLDDLDSSTAYFSSLSYKETTSSQKLPTTPAVLPISTRSYMIHKTDVCAFIKPVSIPFPAPSQFNIPAFVICITRVIQ